mgnify:CR=1 FL=1
MKLIISLLIVTTFFSCNSLKNLEASPECPEGYECKTEVMKNKSISIVEDSIGEKYLKFEDNNEYHTIKYSYSYKGRPEISDDSYSEEIFFQIPVEREELQVEDNSLKDIKLTVAKHCFCPDAGYEVLSQGKFEMLKDNNQYYISLEFNANKDTKLSSIKTKVSL